MSDAIQLGDLSIDFARKDVKHVHLSVHPPTGRVSLVAPLATRVEVARAYAASRLPWIRKQQERFRSQARETPRRMVERETHYVWGRRYLLSVREADARPSVVRTARRITLTVRPGSLRAKRAAVLHEWHKALLHEVVPRIIAKWEPRLGVKVERYFLQRMKTKWGSCNHRVGHIRLNTELVKKPRDLLEYVVVHEMIHMLEPRHSAAFHELMDRHVRNWRDCRQELNELPLP